MKIWRAYGSEHSMNLVIIGEFRDASAAADSRATDQGSGGSRHSVLDVGWEEGVDGPLFQEVAQTGESEVLSLIKLLLHSGAKIKLYSAHDHPTGF